MQPRKSPLLLAIASLCVAGGSLADTALAPVSVTAKGYESETISTPSTVFIAEGEELRNKGAQNLGDALRGEVGFSVNGDSAQGQNPVIRGLKKESIALLVDGMRLNSAQPAGAIASFLSFGLVERVEAVKGPASVLYGTGALGGAINVLTPQARFDQPAKFSAGLSYDTASKGRRATGVGHVSEGDHALVVGGSLARIDDYKTPEGRLKRSGYDSDSFIGQYRYRIDEQQQVRISLQKHQDEDVWYPGSRKPFSHPMPTVADAVGETITHSPKQTRELIEAGYSWKGGAGIPLNTDFRVYRQKMERTIYAWSDNLQRDITTTKVDFKTDGFDAKADWLAHDEHLLSFGLNLWEMKASPVRLNAMPPNSTDYVRTDPFSSGEIRAAGIYVQDDMDFGQLNVLGALRYDRVRGKAASVANSANPTGPRSTENLRRSDDAVSGSLGFSYAVNDWLQPYFSIARGFRAAEMRERYESSPRGDGYYYIGNPQVKPEISTQFELGIKGQTDDFAWSAAIYHNRIRDYMSGQDISATPQAVQLCGPNAAACKETVNISKVVLKGLETQAKWRVADAQWLKAGLSMVRGDNKDLDEPLFQMPADELSLGWEGRVANGWTADVTGRFVRKQDRVASVFSRGTENRTSGFATADLGVTWQPDRRHTLRAVLTNAFDRKYHEHLTEGISGHEILMQGRSLFVSWKGDF